MKKLLLILLCLPMIGFGQNVSIQTLSKKPRVYLNSQYDIAYQETKGWEIDDGISKLTIYRAYQPDTGFTFSINAMKLPINDIDAHNFYDIMLKEFGGIENFKAKMIEKSVNETYKKPLDYSIEKSYLKNFPVLITNFKYLHKDLGNEYEVRDITLQVIRNSHLITFTLMVSERFYKLDTYYFDDIFRHIYFIY